MPAVLMLTHNGETRSLQEWAYRTGMSAQCLGDRLRRGWTMERALSTPLVHRRYQSFERAVAAYLEKEERRESESHGTARSVTGA